MSAAGGGVLGRGADGEERWGWRVRRRRRAEKQRQLALAQDERMKGRGEERRGERLGLLQTAVIIKRSPTAELRLSNSEPRSIPSPTPDGIDSRDPVTHP